MILAAAAARTKTIKLTTAVTVLSSDDPARVYQQLATLDLLSGSRAEIMAGRGSFIESFPLFGYDLSHHDELFAEKLDLLLKIHDSERVTWSGSHRAPLNGQPIYPRTRRDLPIWVAVGSPEQIIEKILFQQERPAHQRYRMQMSVGTMPHAQTMHSIELFGTKVAPVVRKTMAERRNAQPREVATGPSPSRL